MGQSQIPVYQPRGETIAQLLMRQGDIAARGAERSGEIWGRVAENLGNIGAQAYTAHREQKDQQKREAMLGEAMSTFDPQNPMDFYRRTAIAVGPEAAMRVTSGMSSLMKMQQTQQPDPKDAATVVQGLAALEGATPGYLRKNWATVGQALKPVGAVFGIQLPDDSAQLPEDFGQQIIALNQGLNKQTEQAGFTLGPGQVRFGPKGEILAQGPEAPAKPENLSAEEAFIRAQYGDKPTAQQLLEGRSRFAAAGREPDKPPATTELDIPATGVVITTYGTAKRPEVRKQAQERGIPVFESATAATKAGVLAGIYAEAQELKTLMSLDKVKDAIGAASGRWTQLKGKFVDLDPDVQRAIQLMTSLSDTELRKRSGAQINDKEMSRLLRFTTDPNKTVGHNTTALNGLLKSSNRDYHAMSGGVWLSGDPDSEQNDPLGLR